MVETEFATESVFIKVTESAKESVMESAFSLRL